MQQPASTKGGFSRALRALGRPSILGVLALVGVVVGVLGFTRDVTNYTFSIPQVNSSGNIQVDRSPNGAVTQCGPLTGSGEYKNEAAIWVAVTEVAKANYFVKPAQQNPGSTKWAVPDVLFGGDRDAGKSFEVYIFYLPRDFSDFLMSLHKPEERLWSFRDVKSLPAGVGDPKLTVVREGGHKDCGG